jgi:hypothetical protein
MRTLFMPLKPQELMRLAAGLCETLGEYRRGFSQPLERWPHAQRAPALLVCLGAVWWSAVHLGAVVDASGREARQHGLAMLAQSVADAQRQAGSLPALRAQARALGAGARPEPVPVNSVLLRMISAAVDRSGVSLELFEPGRANHAVPAADGDSRETVEDRVLHLKAVGSYAHILRFAEALSALPQPVMALEAQVVPRGGLEVLDTMVRVIGEPMAKNRVPEINGLLLSPLEVTADIGDPFGSADDRAWRSGARNMPVDRVLNQQLVGSFQLGGRRAVLLHKGDRWQLLPLSTQSPMPKVDMRALASGVAPSQLVPQVAPQASQAEERNLQ